MREVILIKQITKNRLNNRGVFVHRTPTAETIKRKGRYVQTTRYAKSAKRYQSIEAANKQIAIFKDFNFLTSWEVVVVNIEPARISATV